MVVGSLKCLHDFSGVIILDDPAADTCEAAPAAHVADKRFQMSPIELAEIVPNTEADFLAGERILGICLFRDVNEMSRYKCREIRHIESVLGTEYQF